ncbi:hypothetical protein AVEN_145322-1 [Araneus ventricosus]|uniref:Uncharacterized protein n=1 Tax=Araneus ventricosus TaxID=182803 RepID=A0A4Y2GKR0_ARAVE|nr:hypothetical protein AVEN_145322-1 [Araneus ventricosus]
MYGKSLCIVNSGPSLLISPNILRQVEEPLHVPAPKSNREMAVRLIFPSARSSPTYKTDERKKWRSLGSAQLLKLSPKQHTKKSSLVRTHALKSLTIPGSFPSVFDNSKKSIRFLRTLFFLFVRNFQ